jgi:NAD(P)-dependent dehydrogenase (short-subunit alcohol dehydrogenase family)
MMATEFHGKTVAVTGAAAGIGLAISELFAARGATLALLDTNAEVELLAARFGSNNSGYRLDVSDERAVEAAFDEIGRTFGGADIVVNNAGIGIIEPAEKLTGAAWDRTMAVNLRGPFLCARAAVPFMFKKRWGRIINIASQAAVIGIEGHVAYSASKAGLLGMTNCMAIEWGPNGVTVNCVSPTVVDTELGRANWSGEKGAKARAEIPTRRFVQPAEVAEAVAFLASDAAGMINGANLLIDGGNTIR